MSRKPDPNDELTPLKICPRHPHAGSFDGRCPACDAERDFLLLTDRLDNRLPHGREGLSVK